jgi:hypothetical protein
MNPENKHLGAKSSSLAFGAPCIVARTQLGETETTTVQIAAVFESVSH